MNLKFFFYGFPPCGELYFEPLKRSKAVIGIKFGKQLYYLSASACLKLNMYDLESAPHPFPTMPYKALVEK